MSIGPRGLHVKGSSSDLRKATKLVLYCLSRVESNFRSELGSLLHSQGHANRAPPTCGLIKNLRLGYGNSTN